MLESEEFGINLISRQYYNIIRKITPNKAEPKIIRGLFITFKKTKFIYRIRVDKELNNAK